jgi:DNA-binding MarR family transcriptional regulator
VRAQAIDVVEQVVIAGVALTTRALAGAGAGMDLTLAQWRTLAVLVDHEDGMRLSTVAAHVGVTLPATGRQLKRLERRGLVLLERDASDRRATTATITPFGASVVKQIVDFRRTELTRTTGKIRLDGAALARLEQIARAMREFL